MPILVSCIRSIQGHALGVTQSLLLRSTFNEFQSSLEGLP